MAYATHNSIGINAVL